MSLFALSGRKWPGHLKLAGTAALALLIVLALMNLTLIGSDAPRGIISLEFAGSPERAAAVVAQWQGISEGLQWARTSLYLDFVFVLAYLWFLLKLTRHWLVDRPGVREQQLGRWARGLFICAAVTDFGENICLLLTLDQPHSSVWPLTGTLFALVKFSSLMAGVAALAVLRAARGHPLTHST